MLLDDVTLYRIVPTAPNRVERLRDSIARLRGGQTLTITAMRGALRDSEFRAYKAHQDAAFPPPTPQQREVLRQYDLHLRRGDSLFARAQKLPSVGLKAMKRSRLISEAQRCYGCAHEMLGELLHQAPLHYLFDRAWVDGNGQSEEPEGMPRRTNSASEHATARWQQVGAEAVSDLQRSVLRYSLNELESKAAEN